MVSDVPTLFSAQPFPFRPVPISSFVTYFCSNVIILFILLLLSEVDVTCWCIQESATESVDALWYHAPDLLLRVSEVSSAADVWSAGCVIAEMLIGQPLFRGTLSKV